MVELCQPFCKTIGPGFLCETYPFQPPNLALIQVAHFNVFGFDGFFNLSVSPQVFHSLSVNIVALLCQTLNQGVVHDHLHTPASSVVFARCPS